MGKLLHIAQPVQVYATRINTRMTSFSNANISVGGDLPVLANIDALRNYTPRGLRSGASVILSGQITPGDANGGVYIWSDASTSADDGYTVVKPVSGFSAGRWLLSIGKGNGSVGPQGPTGPQGQGLPDLTGSAGSALVGYLNSGAGAVPTTVGQTLAQQPIVAAQYGAKFDGTSDDTAALQNAINAAHSLGRTLLLPAGTALISAPLSILGKAVDIRGISGQTIIKARASMTRMIDGVETQDSYYNPASIRDLNLDGNSLVTDAIINVRFRHHLRLENLWTLNPAPTAANIRARDCWLCRYRNLRTLGGATGFHAMGANHSSKWDACSFIGVSGDHLLIDNQAQVADGNHGLTFVGCDVEFPNEATNGVGIRLKSNTSASFFGGYISENFNYAGIINEGGVLDVYAAICFMGYQNKGVLTKPMGGQTRFHACRIADQGSMGFYGMVGLTPAEAATATGKVRFDDMDLYTPLAGGHVMNGDVLMGSIKGPSLGKTIGAGYTPIFNDATMTSTVNGTDRTVTCATTSGANPLIGLYAPLKDTDLIVGKPVYFVAVYKSSKPIVAAMTNAVFGSPIPLIENFPASNGSFSTVVNPLAILQSGATALQVYMPGAAVGDYITLRYVALSDARVSTGNLTGGPIHLGLF